MLGALYLAIVIFSASACPAQQIYITQAPDGTPRITDTPPAGSGEGGIAPARVSEYGRANEGTKIDITAGQPPAAPSAEQTAKDSTREAAGPDEEAEAKAQKAEELRNEILRLERRSHSSAVHDDVGKRTRLRKQIETLTQELDSLR